MSLTQCPFFGDTIVEDSNIDLALRLALSNSVAKLRGEAWNWHFLNRKLVDIDKYRYMDNDYK
jgi:hypothetical protein